MLKLRKNLKKFVSFAIVTAMLICSLFMMSVTAEDIIAAENDIIFTVPVFGENNESIDAMVIDACTHSSYIVHITEHNTYVGHCTFKTKNSCTSCGEIFGGSSGTASPCPGTKYYNGFLVHNGWGY